MSDDVTPNAKQQHDFIVSALKIIGFEQVGDMEIYRQGEKEKQTVVDISAGTSVYFNINGNKVDEDDDEKTLEHIHQIINDAKTGIMPTQSKPDIEIVGTAGTPTPGAVDENTTPTPETQTIPQPTNEVPKPTESVSNIPAVSKPVQELTPILTGVVRPAVSASEALAVWNEFQELQKAILVPSDFQKINGKDFKKKSAWRKFAAFFNLNDKIVEELQTLHNDGSGWTWKIKVICTAPNGRSTEGVGMCSTSERNFSHVEHDTYTTAHTRAKNRAISDMIAAGEVSAEEVST